MNSSLFREAYAILQLPFSFIENRKSGEFHFLWIPFLREHIFKIDSNYKTKDENLYVLQRPIEAVKVPAKLIDDFFNDPAFLVKDEASFYRNFRFAKHLMSEVLSLISVDEVDVGSFQGRMEKLLQAKELQVKNYTFIKDSLVEPMFKSYTHKVQTFWLKDVGYVLVIYTVDRSSQFKVDFYFIPERKRHYISLMTSTSYLDCFK